MGDRNENHERASRTCRRRTPSAVRATTVRPALFLLSWRYGAGLMMTRMPLQPPPVCAERRVSSVRVRVRARKSESRPLGLVVACKMDISDLSFSRQQLAADPNLIERQIAAGGQDFSTSLNDTHTKINAASRGCEVQRD